MPTQRAGRFSARACRVMAQAELLRPKAPRRRQSGRRHEGQVAVGRSDLRWCADGLEIMCDSGKNVTTTFAKNCYDDREVIARRAWEGKGLPSDPLARDSDRAGEEALWVGGSCADSPARLGNLGHISPIGLKRSGLRNCTDQPVTQHGPGMRLQGQDQICFGVRRSSLLLRFLRAPGPVCRRTTFIKAAASS